MPKTAREGLPGGAAALWVARMRLLLIPVLLALATACPLPQPGCTEEVS